MFIVYGQPVFDLAIIFRPFHWDYVLLGLQRGLGGYDWRYPLSLFYPLKEPNVIINASEMSTIYSFYPLGVILALWLIIKKKKRDPLLISLLVFLGMLIFFIPILAAKDSAFGKFHANQGLVLLIGAIIV